MANVSSELTRYASAGRDAVDLATRVLDLVRGIRDPEVRAERLRRRAARVLRRAHLATARGNADRATRLRILAADLWREAEGIAPTPFT